MQVPASFFSTSRPYLTCWMDSVSFSPNGGVWQATFSPMNAYAAAMNFRAFSSLPEASAPPDHLAIRFDPMDPSVAAASPVTHARPDAPPFLSIYGLRDLPEQGDLLHGRLKKAGAPSRLVVIPGAGHGLAGVAGTGDLMAEFLRGDCPSDPDGRIASGCLESVLEA